MQSNQASQNLLIQDFYKSHNSWLYSWLLKKLGSTFDAADLAQDTFTRMLSKNDADQILEPRAYLTRIAHDLMVSMLRRRDLERSYHATLCDPYEIEYPSPEVRAMALEALIAVDEMLNGLSPKVREAYLLMQLDGLKYAEIAQKLDISVKTVGVYIAKAVLHCISFER
jgi:RNA polymerase sigma factor (sigma-70 family)